MNATVFSPSPTAPLQRERGESVHAIALALVIAYVPNPRKLVSYVVNFYRI